MAALYAKTPAKLIIPSRTCFSDKASFQAKHAIICTVICVDQATNSIRAPALNKGKKGINCSHGIFCEAPESGMPQQDAIII